jgi:hypothetical protein
MKEISIEEMPQGCVLTHDRGQSITVSSFEDAAIIIESLQRMIATQRVHMRYWQHDETGRQCARETKPSSPRWFEITKEQYEGINGADAYPAKPSRR